MNIEAHAAAVSVLCDSFANFPNYGLGSGVATAAPLCDYVASHIRLASTTSRRIVCRARLD